jgi:hypothetical protein
MVSDLSPISHMTDLNNLVLRRTPVSDLSPIARTRSLLILDITETDVSDLGPIAELTNLVSYAEKDPKGGGLFFWGCPLADSFLLKLADKENPERTIETIAYLRRQQGLPSRVDDDEDWSETDPPEGNNKPSIEAIPPPEPIAIQFGREADGPIDIASISAAGEQLLDEPYRREDYFEIRMKAVDLHSMGRNRLGSVTTSIDRFLDLPEKMERVRAKLFWSRVNTLRIKLATHDEAYASGKRDGDPDDRLLEQSVVPLLRDLVETINVFVLGDSALMNLDAARPGPEEIAAASEEVKTLTKTLHDLTSNGSVATKEAREVLEEQTENMNTKTDTLAGRQGVEFSRRSIRNFIGELLRRAYARVQTLSIAAKGEAGLAWKGAREGAYRATGAGVITGGVTDMLGVTNFTNAFVEFVVQHADSLTAYVIRAFSKSNTGRNYTLDSEARLIA